MKRSEVHALLARHGLRLHRELGQNFLVDPALAARLVEEAGVEPGEAVLEVGTGFGALTRALVDAGAHVTTIEIDAGVVRALREDSLLPEGVVLHHADALALDLGSLLPAEGPARVVANLPYSATGPLLRRLLDLRGRVRGLAFMVQREVARRLVAEPRSRDFGSLSVLYQIATEVSCRLDLPGTAFEPKPAIASTFVRATPLAAAPTDEELEGLERVARAAFGLRRKTLANALRRAPDVVAPERIAPALEARGLPLNVRAEEIEVAAWPALVEALVSAGDGSGDRGGNLSG